MKTIFRTLLLTLAIVAFTVTYTPVVLGQDAKAKTEVVNKTAPVEEPSGVTPPTVTTLKSSDNDVPTEPELPPDGTTFWEWVLWLVGVIGMTNIIRLIFRMIPTNSNVDWIGKIVQIINILLGAWLPNSEKGGLTFKRNYSLHRKD